MKKYLIIFALFALTCLTADPLLPLYPPLEVNQSGFLKVGEIHSIYWEESGNPEGQPILFVHGGPGMGTEARQRQYFDPSQYRIILFDQRGCGKSKPFASLKNNTTWDLVEDIEELRKLLKIDQWIIFGGSWGSTLGLTYAIKYPQYVLGLILRGIFLCRDKEISWFYQFGAHKIFPDFWEDYIKPIPIEERGDMVQAFYQRLTSSDYKVKEEATRAWAIWEGKASKLKFDPVSLKRVTPKTAYSLALIESYYFFNQAFFDNDNWILDNIETICHLPCVIIQGRYDMICPMESAWELYKKWPGAQLEIVSEAGHSSSELGIIDALVRATNSFVSPQ